MAPDGEYLLYVADEGERLNLYRYDRRTGTREQLTAHDCPVVGGYVTLDADGEAIAYATNEADNPENRDVYVVDPNGGEPRRLDIGETGAQATVGDDTPDLDRVGVYDLREDTVSWLSDGTAVEEPVSVSPDGKRAVALRTREAATVPVVYDLAADESRELDLREGVSRPVGGRDGGFVGRSWLLCTHQTGTKRSEVVGYDLDADGVETVLAAEYGDVDPAAFVAPEYVTYESADGLEIGALLYEPREEPGPAIVKVHGGPTAWSKRGFDRYTQFLVNQGYAVLDPNYRGSTGRGREFRNRIRNDWGGMEQVDVRRGAEWLAERDSVAPDRIAVFGVSYGGYSTYCQLTMHPEPWACGVAWVGMTDLLALYDESMARFQSYLEDQLGDPATNEAFYRERSPIAHVANVDAPICMLHGTNDPRCPISQARRLRDALEERGLEAGEDGMFEYAELGGRVTARPTSNRRSVRSRCWRTSSTVGCKTLASPRASSAGTESDRRADLTLLYRRQPSSAYGESECSGGVRIVRRAVVPASRRRGERSGSQTRESRRGVRLASPRRRRRTVLPHRRATTDRTPRGGRRRVRGR